MYRSLISMQSTSPNGGSLSRAAADSVLRQRSPGNSRVGPKFTETRSTQVRRIKDSITLSAFQIFAFLFWSTAGAAQPAASSTGLTNIFAPESTPAKSIFHLSMFVLAITAIIFVVVFTLLVYSVLKLCGRTAYADREPALVYGSRQIELAWTSFLFLIVVLLVLSSVRVIYFV